MAMSTPLEEKSSTNQLGWEEYVMANAYLAAQRSKDPDTQVGACIVNEDNRIIGIGYNAMPKGCSDDTFPWEKNKCDRENSKFTYVAHAELNAIIHKKVSDKNCTLYVTLFPCKECTQLIIRKYIPKQQKIVIDFTKIDNTEHEAGTSKRMSETADVEAKECIPKRKRDQINFTEIEGIQLPSTALEKDSHE